MTTLKAILTKLSEKSTVAGIIGLVTVATGYALVPERAEAIAAIVAGLAGIGLIAVPEAK